MTSKLRQTPSKTTRLQRPAPAPSQTGDPRTGPQKTGPQSTAPRAGDVKADAGQPTTRGGDAFDILRQNPYSFDATGQTPVSDARVQSFDRLGLGAMNAISARIATLTGAKRTVTVDADRILGAVANHPHRQTPIADGIPSVEALLPPIADFAAERAKTVDLLAKFPVARADGTDPMTLLEKISTSNLRAAQQARVIDVFTEFSHSLGLRDFDPGSSDVNWKHVSGEAAQVLDAAEKKNLSPEQTEIALLASLFSDAVKFPATLLTHNIDGAIGAYHVLSRRGDLDKNTIAAVVAATKEHQVGPPSFMAMLASFKLRAVAPANDPKTDKMIAAIQMKIATPLDERHVVSDGGAAKIAFTPEEQRLLQAAGIDEWAVPSPASPWFDASMAVITGDSLVNYAMPEGVGKIVALSGPGTMFKNPTVFDSIFSNGTSFLDARSLLPKAFQELADTGAALTRRGIDRVRQEVGAQLETGSLKFDAATFDALLAQEKVDLGPLNVRRNGHEVVVDVPGDPKNVPYFHAPLDFPAGEAREPGADAAYEFAKLIRRTVADALRSTSPASLVVDSGTEGDR